MTPPEQQDELTQRYRQASAADTRRPAAGVRGAVFAHARMLAGARQRNTGTTKQAVKPLAPAANQARWKMSMLASVAVLGLAGLLMLQLDRGTPQEKELTLGQRVPGPPPQAVSVAPASPMPAVPAPRQFETWPAGD